MSYPLLPIIDFIVFQLLLRKQGCKFETSLLYRCHYSNKYRKFNALVTHLLAHRFLIKRRMTTLRPFVVDDLFRFNNINLDVLTETYYMGFYMDYLSRWPDYFVAQEAPDGQLMAYIMGKAEGKQEKWHGHVTAVTVAPEYRRLGLARTLMDFLETVSTDVYNGYFVDLYVIGYYNGGEDAYDMRKALPRDVEKKSIIPLPHPVYPGEDD